jgi:molybdopterin-biosynthesis enzyme MoeA-like protein
VRVSWLHIALAVVLAAAALLFIHLRNAGGIGPTSHDMTAPAARLVQPG